PTRSGNAPRILLPIPRVHEFGVGSDRGPGGGFAPTPRDAQKGVGTTPARDRAGSETPRPRHRPAPQRRRPVLLASAGLSAPSARLTRDDGPRDGPRGPLADLLQLRPGFRRKWPCAT